MQGLKNDVLVEMMTFLDPVSRLNFLSISRLSAELRFDYEAWAKKIHDLYKDSENFEAFWPNLNKLLQDISKLHAVNFAQLYTRLAIDLPCFYDESCFENAYLIILNMAALSGKAEAFGPVFELIAKSYIERAVKKSFKWALELAEELSVVPEALANHPQAIKKAIEKLVELGHDYDKLRGLRGNALTFAGISGNPAMIDAVLAFGYDPLKTSHHEYKTLLEAAAVGGNPAAIEKALSIVGNGHFGLMTLAYAFKSGNIAAIDYVLSKIPEGVEVKFDGNIECGNGLIHFALESGKLEVVKKAIELGCNPEPVLDWLKRGHFAGDLQWVEKSQKLLEEAAHPWLQRKVAKEAAKNAAAFLRYKGHEDIPPQQTVPDA